MLIAITHSRYRFFFIAHIGPPPPPPGPPDPPRPKKCTFCAPPRFPGGRKKWGFTPHPRSKNFFIVIQLWFLGGPNTPILAEKWPSYSIFFVSEFQLQKWNSSYFFFFPFWGSSLPPKREKKNNWNLFLHIDYTPLLKKMTFSKMQAFFSMSSFFFVV